MLIKELALPPPGRILKLFTVGDRLKLGCGIVSTTVVELVAIPEVPETFNGYVPATAETLTLKVSASVLALTVVKDEVTPPGRPDTVKTGLFASPTVLVTLISIGRFQPFWPTVRVILLADDVRLKLGAGMVTTIVVVLAVVPEVPLIVIGYVPATAEALAVTVSVIGLVALATGQLS